MTRTPSPVPEITDAIHVLVKLLTPAEIASVAGSLLELVNVDEATAHAFTAELSEGNLEAFRAMMEN